MKLNSHQCTNPSGQGLRAAEAICRQVTDLCGYCQFFLSPQCKQQQAHWERTSHKHSSEAPAHDVQVSIT